MDGRAIVITSGKGGVGKTTTTANLGVALAQSGKRVVVVDADIGLRNLDVVMGLENRIVYNLVDAIKGRCRLRQALIKDKRIENLFLLPASQTDDKTAVTPEQMQQVSTELKKEFDFILFDSPAGIEQGFRNAVAGADEAILVTTPEVSAIRDADRVIGLLQASANEPQLIINRLSAAMVQRGDMLDREDIIDILGIPLLGIIPEDEGIIVSSNRGVPIALNNTYAAGAAFRRIARRLLGEDVPLPSFQDQTSLLSRLGNFLSAGWKRKGS
ncbi:MAG: septum site-determining protein MinD [Nitrospinota bacterium]|nr:MAG: septum site-determining protein MinD [Nitrospinota bacterium]